MIAIEQKRVLIIGFVWPESTSSAAGKRMMQLISFFKEREYELVFASTASESEFSDELDGIVKISIQLNSSTFDSMITEMHPSIVLFDRFMTEEQFGWRIAQFCPDAIRILDSEDLHCLREARKQTILKNKTFDLNSDLAKREIASIYRCDLTLIISEYEVALLETYFKIPSFLLLYLPLWAEMSVLDGFEFEKRNDFIFIGNFLHAPNHDAVLYLKEHIWPLIFAQLPDSKMHIYGAYPTNAIKPCHHPKSNFFVHGRTEKIENIFLTARLLLAPIRFGAGIKGKLLESMQFGTPNVTTSTGAEGMFGTMAWNGAIADSPKDFAEKAIMLYDNKITWQEAQQNGYSILNSRFTKDKFDMSLENGLDDKCAHIEKYRSENFTGLMLMHHTMQSTKYMAKWIEAKNQNS
jgi:glycosyltransferase involved in cell wall biosynthesis